MGRTMSHGNKADRNACHVTRLMLARKSLITRFYRKNWNAV